MMCTPLKLLSPFDIKGRFWHARAFSRRNYAPPDFGACRRVEGSPRTDGDDGTRRYAHSKGLWSAPYRALHGATRYHVTAGRRRGLDASTKRYPRWCASLLPNPFGAVLDYQEGRIWRRIQVADHTVALISLTDNECCVRQCLSS